MIMPVCFLYRNNFPIGSIMCQYILARKCLLIRHNDGLQDLYDKYRYHLGQRPSQSKIKLHRSLAFFPFLDF